MKFAIVDPVGQKAGMNCYDLGLLHALHRKNVSVFSISNFKDRNYPYIKQKDDFLFEKKGALLTINNFVYAHLSAGFFLKRKKISWVLLHVFSTSAKDYFSLKVMKFFGRKIIAIIHDVESLSNEDKDVYKERIYNMADILVVHNQTSYQSISENIAAQNSNKIRIIPHGNYLDFISEDPAPRSSSIDVHFDKKYKYLLFFGQIKPVKGLDILLSAIALLPPDYKLVIAGRPHRDDFARYEQIISEIGIGDRVERIIRFITDEERDYLFKQCDALVLPYRKIFQSGVLLMAMSYGLPVVASDLPANKEVIDDGYNGVLFEDGNYEKLAVKIEMLFDNNIKTIKEHVFTSIRDKYSWDKIAEQYLEIIAED